MKCPRCGSGKVHSVHLKFMLKYTCLECYNAWADQTDELPRPKDGRGGREERDG